jgi:oxaloacetate decarboxylase alpha subunit
MPLNPEVEVRIRLSKRAKELEEKPHMASLDELRARIGKGYSDEEFLLRAVMPAEQVDAMKAAGHAPREYNPQVRALNYLVGELTKRPKLTGVKITKPGFSLDLNGGR